ncbi:MAG TPA: hypothetical protein VHX61_06325 [Rhizomicrobium sp.]|nr:hypothetical protein [Rhizomicrobium sp.]
MMQRVKHVIGQRFAKEALVYKPQRAAELALSHPQRQGMRTIIFLGSNFASPGKPCLRRCLQRSPDSFSKRAPCSTVPAPAAESTLLGEYPRLSLQIHSGKHITAPQNNLRPCYLSVPVNRTTTECRVTCSAENSQKAR